MLSYDDRTQLEKDLCHKLEGDIKKAVRHFMNVAQLGDVDARSATASIGVTLLSTAIDYTVLTTVATSEQFGRQMQHAFEMTRVARDMEAAQA